MCALSKLGEVCRKVCSGDIAVHELKTISGKETQMSKLCAAAAPQEQTEDGKGGQAGEIPSYEIVKKHLDMRLKEFHYFKTYCAQLTHFLNLSSLVVLTGKHV